ncbi:MAG: T9SS type A sorting domain-containing protein, partial [bacterium]|nr:T9SS type A sorting domain-containing protein [bacterium]
VDSTGVTFNYANYNAIKVGFYDNTCNWKKPTSMRFLFNTSNYYPNYDKSISFEKLRFRYDAPTVPLINVSGSKTFCEGDSVRLTSSISNTYLWSNGSINQSITVKTSGNYTVTVKDIKGCPLPSAPSTINVNNAPIASITTNKSTTFCEGDNVVLSASNGASFLWSNNETSSSITVSNSGTYNLIVKDNIGCTSLPSNNVSIVVNPLPTAPIITSNKITTFCEGDTITLTSSLANSYLWSNNQTTQSIQVLGAGDYFVKALNIFGCSAVSTKTSTIMNVIPKTVITTNGPTTFCEGESVVLTASPALAYLWSNNETTQSITVDAPGDNYVVTKDINQCLSISPKTTISVNPIPAVPTIQVNGDQLNSNYQNGNQWFLNNNLLPGETSQTLLVKQNGFYSVHVSNTSNCQSVSDPYHFTNSTMVSSNNLKTDLNIVPNPGTGIFQIIQTRVEPFSITIYNAIGEIVYQAMEASTTLDLSMFAKGIYHFEFETNTSKINKKVVLN